MALAKRREDVVKNRLHGHGGRRLLTSAVAAAALVAAGCGANSDQTTSATTVAAASATTATTSSQFPHYPPPTESNSAKGLGAKKIGLVVITEASEIFPLEQTALQAAFSHLGWTMQINNLDGNIAGVPQAVENLIQAGASAVVLMSVEPSFVGKQALALAKSKGVPIIGNSTGVPTPQSAGVLDGAVETPMEQPGVQEGKAMVNELGSGSQVAFIIDQLASTGRAAQKGVQEGIGGKLDIVAKHQLNYAKLVPDVAATVQQWLVQYPNLKAIWCPYDGACVGAAQAVASSGKHVQVWSLDGTPTAFKDIRQGQPYVTWAAPYDYVNWLTADVLVSVFQHRPPDPSAENLQMLRIDKRNVPATGELSGDLLYGDFQQAFEKRWGVAK
jgi:ribose transport system substrate-binding protein